MLKKVLFLCVLLGASALLTTASAYRIEGRIEGNFGGAYMLYRIEAMPTYVLIDPQGKIIERRTGESQKMIEQVKALLDGKQ